MSKSKVAFCLGGCTIYLCACIFWTAVIAFPEKPLKQGGAMLVEVLRNIGKVAENYAGTAAIIFIALVLAAIFLILAIGVLSKRHAS